MSVVGADAQQNKCVGPNELCRPGGKVWVTADVSVAPMQILRSTTFLPAGEVRSTQWDKCTCGALKVSAKGQLCNRVNWCRCPGVDILWAQAIFTSKLSVAAFARSTWDTGTFQGSWTASTESVEIMTGCDCSRLRRSLAVNASEIAFSSASVNSGLGVA